MAARLQAAGVRPISSIVDITNYVNLEIGQPMHAFDLGRLAGPEIRIRRARPGETITTLDNVARKLDPDMLVIADRDRAQAIAGVMGGAASEVTDATTTIALESAYFKPASVRRTSKRLGLKTEASTRFERGADISAQMVANRAIHRADDADWRRPGRRRSRRLLPASTRTRADPSAARSADAAAGRVSAGRGCGADSHAPGTRGRRRLRRLGRRRADLPRGSAARGRPHRGSRPACRLRQARADVPRRHHGGAAADPRIGRDQLVRRILAAAGLSEAVTFGFIEAKAVEAFSSAAVAVANPLSAKFDTLRPALLPGLVDAVAHNRRHGRRDVGLFEIGARFAVDGETRGVGLAWTGNGAFEHWSGGQREVDFFDAKGLVQELCDALGVPATFAPADDPFLVPGQAASVLVAGESGDAARVASSVRSRRRFAEARGLPRQDRVFAAELNLDALARARVATADATRSLPRHPFVVRDLSVVVADTLPAEIIRGTIHAAGRDTPAPLASVSFFDRYQGQGVPQGGVSLSVRLTFQAADRTLIDSEVQQSVDTILAALIREHGAIQR
jgi:phenylalanyl-tRNA synthetase beta chain